MGEGEGRALRVRSLSARGRGAGSQAQGPRRKGGTPRAIVWELHAVDPNGGPGGEVAGMAAAPSHIKLFRCPSLLASPRRWCLCCSLQVRTLRCCWRFTTYAQRVGAGGGGGVGVVGWGRGEATGGSPRGGGGDCSGWSGPAHKALTGTYAKRAPAGGRQGRWLAAMPWAKRGDIPWRGRAGALGHPLAVMEHRGDPLSATPVHSLASRRGPLPRR